MDADNTLKNNLSLTFIQGETERYFCVVCVGILSDDFRNWVRKQEVVVGRGRIGS